MSSRRRYSRRRTLSAAACLLSLALYAFSLRWHTSYRYYGAWSAALTHGALIYEEFTPPLQSPHRWGGSDVATCSTQFFSNDFSPTWRPSFRRSGPPNPMLSITFPLWIPIPLLALLTWHTHRRIRALDLIGRCPRCRYDQQGLAPATPCPECGRPATT
jgi:hypothetical protein